MDVCVCTGVCEYTWMCVCVCVQGPGRGAWLGAVGGPSDCSGAPEPPRGGELHRPASGPFGTDTLATPCAGLAVSLGLSCAGAVA